MEIILRDAWISAYFEYYCEDWVGLISADIVINICHDLLI